MATFRYQTIEAGKPTAGTLQAATLDAAADLLHARGRVILDLALAEASIIRLPRRSIIAGASTRDVANFTSQLAVMVRAGISIRAAVEGIGEQVTHPPFKSMLVQMHQDIENGLPLFRSGSARYPKSFSPLYVNMFKASEMSGGFPAKLDRIAGYLNQQLETRAMIVGAMTYPAIIAIMAVAATIFLLMFVLPRFLVFICREGSGVARLHQVPDGDVRIRSLAIGMCR